MAAKYFWFAPLGRWSLTNLALFVIGFWVFAGANRYEYPRIVYLWNAEHYQSDLFRIQRLENVRRGSDWYEGQLLSTGKSLRHSCEGVLIPDRGTRQSLQRGGTSLIPVLVAKDHWNAEADVQATVLINQYHRPRSWRSEAKWIMATYGLLVLSLIGIATETIVRTYFHFRNPTRKWPHYATPKLTADLGSARFLNLPFHSHVQQFRSLGWTRCIHKRVIVYPHLGVRLTFDCHWQLARVRLQLIEDPKKDNDAFGGKIFVDGKKTPKVWSRKRVLVHLGNPDVIKESDIGELWSYQFPNAIIQLEFNQNRNVIWVEYSAAT